MDVAIAENDKATQEFLRWFVNEQVERVAKGWFPANPKRQGK